MGVDVDPVPMTRRWPDPVLGPYSLRVWFGHPGGVPAVVGVEMWGVEPVTQPWAVDGGPIQGEGMADTPITAQAVRVPLGGLLDAWVALHGNAAQPQPAPERATLKLREDLLKTARQIEREIFLREVAGVYQTALSAGSRRPAKEVEEWAADRPGGPFSSSTVRSWIKQAADRGHLPKSSQGKVRRQMSDALQKEES